LSYRPTAADNVGVAGVQFILDGAPLGFEVSQSRLTLELERNDRGDRWHTLAARARDAATNQTTSTTVSVTVAIATPTITWPTPANNVYGAALSGTQLNADGERAGTLIYTPAAGRCCRPERADRCR